MSKQQVLPESVEFVLTRIPEVRVIFADYDSSMIQVLAGDRACLFRGTEHRLWLFARAFVSETTEAFAEQATERSRAQACRLCALQDLIDRLEQDLDRVRGDCRLERALRARLEKELVRRDGENRVRALVAGLARESAIALRSTKEATR